MSKVIGFWLVAVCCSAASFAADSKDKQQKDDGKPAEITVHARDYCDPASFGAALCNRDVTTGAITFAGFGAELVAEKSAGAWRFIPSSTDAPEGANISLSNFGGETHTFTRVKKFGGGFVAALNGPAGTPDPAPECAQTVNGALAPQPPSANNVFLPAGATGKAEVKEGEVAHFQCCIHPWMHTTIDSRDEQHKRSDSQQQSSDAP